MKAKCLINEKKGRAYITVEQNSQGRLSFSGEVELCSLKWQYLSRSLYRIPGEKNVGRGEKEIGLKMVSTM